MEAYDLSKAWKQGQQETPLEGRQRFDSVSVVVSREVFASFTDLLAVRQFLSTNLGGDAWS